MGEVRSNLLLFLVLLLIFVSLVSPIAIHSKMDNLSTGKATATGVVQLTVSDTVCGDAVCDPDESCSTCSADCGACDDGGDSGGGAAGGSGGGGAARQQVVHMLDFVSKEEFERMIADDELLEYAVVHSDNYYGTSKKDIMEPLKQGSVVVREVDIQGFHSIQKLVPKENLVSIFMEVPDLEDLKQRILRRGALSDEELQHRMDSAMKELAQAGTCDYRVSNEWGKIAECVSEVEKIVLKEIEGMY